MAIGEEEFKPISFRKLMQLKQLHADTYESVSPAWPPSSPQHKGRRAFGGHVYAQSAWAASKTVGRGFVVHNITGHFLLPGEVTTPFIYHVNRVRDGGIYCLRRVEVYQNSKVAGSGKIPCFVSTISFKRDELKGRTVEYAHQDAPRDHLQTKYGSLINDKAPEDHKHSPGADADWCDPTLVQAWAKNAEVFPGVEIRKVDMTPLNGIASPGGGANGEKASQWRQLLFYRMRKEGPGDMDEANLNLHACAHMYASDRNSLFLAQRALGYEKELAAMGSLAHTVVFHGAAEDMRMVDERDDDKWFVQEAWTSASGENRLVHNSRLWDYANGRVIAQTVQDGMMRIPLEKAESKL